MCRKTCGTCGETSSGDQKLVEVEDLMPNEFLQESRKDEKHHEEIEHKMKKNEEKFDDFVDAFLDASGYLYQFSDSSCSRIGKNCVFSLISVHLYRKITPKLITYTKS